jgi:hypothetical protein
MKITVKQVGQGWKPKDKPDADPLYSIMLVDWSEPQKTYDPELAVVGEHEAEQYQSKSGKTYWRVPKGSASQASYTPASEAKASDPTRSSIEKQQALIQAVAFVNGDMGGDDRLKQVEAAYHRFVELLGE